MPRASPKPKLRNRRKSIPPAYPKRRTAQLAKPGELIVPYLTLDRHGDEVKKETRIELLQLAPLDGHALPLELRQPHTFIHVVRSRKHDPKDSVYYLLGTGTYKATGIDGQAIRQAGVAYDVRNNSPIVEEAYTLKELGKGTPSRLLHITRHDGKPPRTLKDRHSFVHLNQYAHDREACTHSYYTLGEVKFVLPVRNVE